jgi:outer membrane protein OmpA-like peptidoglycan-associated protein
MNTNLTQRIIIFSILGIILGYFLFLTFSNEVDPTPELYYKYEDPILKKIRNLKIEKVQNVLIDTISIVYFKTNSSEILDSSSIWYVARHNLAKTIIVKGHTDNSGLETTNLKLSNKRANSVCELLVKYRSLGSISGEGYGASHPARSNNVASNMKYNRRTEILWKKSNE